MSANPFLFVQRLLDLGDNPTEMQAQDAVRRAIPASEIRFNNGQLSASVRGLGVLCRKILTGEVKGNPVNAHKLLVEFRQPFPKPEEPIPVWVRRAIHQAVIDGKLEGDREAARQQLISLDQ